MNIWKKKRFHKFTKFMMNLEPDAFRYDRVVTNSEKLGIKKEPHLCNTVCCAYGYMPIIFPKVFTYQQTLFRRFGSYGLDMKEPYNEFPGPFLGLDDRLTRTLFSGFSHPDLNILSKGAGDTDIMREVTLKEWQDDVLLPIYKHLIGEDYHEDNF